MPTKTPRFEAALAEYYRDKRPHTPLCQETGASFEISDRDIELYHSLGLPLPTVAPWVRLRRLRAAAGGFDLFKRTLADGRTVISMFDPESPVPILPAEEWNADTFNALSYGIPVEPNASFFTQWERLSLSVPRPAILHDPKSENSPWALYDYAMKNCYFTYQGMECEDLLYSDYNVSSKRCVDTTGAFHSEDCYDSLLLYHCVRTFFSESCEGCMDVAFSLGCRNCTDCFGCTNLRNKKFCFLNEQLTEEAYRAKCTSIDLSDARVVEEWKQRIKQKYWNTTFQRAGILNGSERSIGDDLIDCRDVEGIGMTGGERVYNSFGLTACKDTVDLTLGLELERCANLLNCTYGYENKMVNTCMDCIGVEYSEYLTNCEYCFGCIGLRRKKFCVFNVQYTEDEYWHLVDDIKTRMLAEGTYGEYFPYRLSGWAYNTSHAGVQFPLSVTGAQALGARWYSYSAEQQASCESIQTLPQKLGDTDESVITRAFCCPESQRAFRFVKPELEWHRQHGIALPRVHPTVRRKERTAKSYSIVAITHRCGDCGQAVGSRLPLSHPAPLLCETCYEQRVLS